MDELAKQVGHETWTLNDLLQRLGRVDDLLQRLARVEEEVHAVGPLMDARFVRIEAMIKYEADKVALALSASDKAITKAENATEKRLESVNEFRAQLSDQAKTFLTRDTFDTANHIGTQDREALRGQLSDLRLALTGLMTREQVGDSLKLVEAGIERNREDITGLSKAQSRMIGISVGVSSAVSIIGILIAIVFRLASGN